MKVAYRKELYIPFHLSDAAGILFFGHIFSLAHEAYEFFVQEALNISWDDWFNHSEWVIPIKQTQACYHHPISVGSIYFFNVNVKKIGITSFVLTYQLAQHDRLFCEIEMVHVFCSRHTKQKVPLPIFIKEKLLSLI